MLYILVLLSKNTASFCAKGSYDNRSLSLAGPLRFSRVMYFVTRYLFHQGDQTSIAPASSADRLGLRGSLLFRYLLLKTRLQIMEDYQLDAL
jgi:hypothetical protein